MIRDIDIVQLHFHIFTFLHCLVVSQCPRPNWPFVKWRRTSWQGQDCWRCALTKDEGTGRWTVLCSVGSLQCVLFSRGANLPSWPFPCLSRKNVRWWPVGTHRPNAPLDSALVEPAPMNGFGVKKYHVPILHVQVHHTVQFLVCQIDDSKVRQIDKVTLRVRMRS